jgi:hypothetical protein
MGSDASKAGRFAGYFHAAAPRRSPADQAAALMRMKSA